MNDPMQTVCTLCLRTVGVVQNWSRWQAGQPIEWRVVRHRQNEIRRRGVRNTICPGTGINVGTDLVFPRKEQA